MSDCLKNLTTNVTITEDIIETNSYTPELIQIITKALDGSIYIQNHGQINHRVVATILLDSDQDALLDNAYLNGDLVQLVDDDRIYQGYLVGTKPSVKYVDTYHECQITIQEAPV